MEVSAESGSTLSKFPGMQELALSVARHIYNQDRKNAAFLAATKDAHRGAGASALAAATAAAAEMAAEHDDAGPGEEEDGGEEDDDGEEEDGEQEEEEEEGEGEEEDTAGGGGHEGGSDLHQLLPTADGFRARDAASARKSAEELHPIGVLAAGAGFDVDPVVSAALESLKMANEATKRAECAHEPGHVVYLPDNALAAADPVAAEIPAPEVPDAKKNKNGKDDNPASVSANILAADESAHGVSPESIGLPNGVQFSMPAKALKKCPFKTPARFPK